MIKVLTKDLLQFFLFRQTFFWRLPAESKRTIAITFDDGPDPDFTPQVLEILARCEVQGNFFLVGRKAEKLPKLVQEIAAGGHLIANHSHDHIEYVRLSPKEREADWEKTQTVLAGITGVRPGIFRPPRGKFNLALLNQMRSLGQRVILWSRTSSDYRKDGAEAIYARVHPDTIRPGEILLFHDHNAGTVEALSRLIPELQCRSFYFGTFDSQ